MGLAPDFIVCRSATEVDISSRQKISLFCNVPPENVVSIYDVPNIYHVPSVMIEQRMHSLLAKRLQLGSRDAADAAAVELDTAMKASWEGLADKVDNAAGTARIALVGKYCDLSDSYLSVTSALKHACIATDQKLDLVLVESTNLELEMQKTNPELYAAAWEMLNSADGVLVPGGFGVRGIEGKVQAIRYAREAGVPFLGICLGMQAAVIEYARAMLNKPQANSSEFAPDIPEEDAAVVFMPEGDREKMGGTMRLGVRKTIIKPESLAHQLYEGRPAVLERHRHRYEVNPLLVSELESHGLRFTGKDEANQRMEIVELDKEVHPYFIAAQFHPEFKSRPQRPAPLFYGLLQAVKEKHASAKSGDYAMNLNADPSAEIASSTSTVKTTPATAD